jgi:hypothetical protein
MSFKHQLYCFPEKSIVQSAYFPPENYLIKISTSIKTFAYKNMTVINNIEAKDERQ